MKEKKAFTFFSLLLFTTLLVCGPSSYAGSIKSPIKWSISKLDMYSQGDSVVVRLYYSFQNSTVAPKTAYVLQPRISDGAHMILLRPVSIYHAGAEDNTAQVRSGNLPASGVENEIRLVSGKMNDEVVVEDILRKESWMDVCTISILTSEWQWKDRCRTDRLIEVARATYPDHIYFKCELSPVEPELTEFRTMEDSFPLYLEYAGEGDAVIPSLGNNHQALMLFSSRITSLSDDPRVTIKTLNIDNWTAPDRYTDANERTSDNRISSLKSYLSSSGFRYFSSARFTPRGEDWDGMTGWLKKTYYWSTSSLDALFADNTGRDRIKANLKERYPEIYSDLCRHCFPELDRFMCTIRYEVCEFTSDTQIWEAFNNDIRLLYPHDFWVIAKRFPYDTDPWRNIFLSGAERYPKDVFSNINAAVALIRMARYNDAYEYISRCLSQEEINPRAEEYLQYLWGVWQMYAGDPYYGARLLERFKDSDGYLESAYDSATSVIRSLENTISWEVSIILE